MTRWDQRNGCHSHSLPAISRRPRRRLQGWTTRTTTCTWSTQLLQIHPQPWWTVVSCTCSGLSSSHVAPRISVHHNAVCGTCRNTNIINTCVVFRQWHIHSNIQFFLSCIAVVLIGVGYEWLRDIQKKVDRRIAAQVLLKGKRAVSRRHQLESESEVAENEPLLIGADTSKAGRR
jgi:hypothetical protein